MASLSSYYPQPLPIGTTSESVVVSTGSSASRSLGDRFGEVFNVADFGAVGNGTTDDTAAIQAAINAAVAAGGGTIHFEPSKTYFCNTRANPSAGQTTLGKHLHVIGGTANLKLRFLGNGATLYSSTYNASGTDLVYVYSRFYSLEFFDLKFERAPHTKTSTGAPTTGVRIIAYDQEKVDLIRFNNCQFFDCHNAVVVQTDVGSLRPMSGMFRRCRRFECIGCSFLYPRGGSHSNSSGDVTVSLTHWVNDAVFDRVYFDGAVGSVLPAGIPYAKDGFLFPHPKHLHVTNSFFTNYQFEGFKDSSTETLTLTVLTAPFIQAAIGATVTATLHSSTNVKDYLTIGRVYAVYSPLRWETGIVGYYKVISSSSQTFSAGVQIVLERVNKAPYHGLGPELADGQTNADTYWIFMDVEENNSSSVYDNNVFYNVPLKQANGNLVATSPAHIWAHPCILSGSSIVATNNYFYGGEVAIVMEPYTFTNNKPSIISNNLFYVYSPFASQQSSPSRVASLYQPNCRFSDNQIVVQHPKDIVYAIFVSNSNIQITNNSMAVIETASVAQKTRFVNFNNGGPYPNVVVEGNYLSNVDNYINAAEAHVVGPFFGSINSTVSTTGSEDQLAKIRITTRSPNGVVKLLKTENDGTITVEYL